MYVVIMAGEQPKAEVDTGIDMYEETIGSIDDDDYFVKMSDLCGQWD